jgi:hypothetical protein
MPLEPSTGGNPAVAAPTGGGHALTPTPAPGPASPRPQAAPAPSPTPRPEPAAADAQTKPKTKTRRKTRIRARKVHRIVRHVDPWSVLKLSLLFYLCVFLIVLVASVVLWSVGRSTGTVDDVESFISDLGTFGSCKPESSLPPGTKFRIDQGCAAEGDDLVLVGGFTFEDGRLLQGAAVVGMILVLGGAAANGLLAVLFNLMSDLTGGVRVTVLEEEPRQRRSTSSPPT